MKKHIDTKFFISAVVTLATVFSLGCISMADEVEATEGVENTDVIEETVDDDMIIVESVEEIVTSEADYAPANGWDEYSAGKWKYYENGAVVKGWKQIDGKWYWFNTSGVMFTGKRYDSEFEATYIFGINGVMLTDCWQRFDNSWYYLNHYGRAVKGWNQIDGKWYYFVDSQNPYMYKNDIKKIGETDWYLFSSTGEMLTGWQQYRNRWYYFDPATGKAVSGWKQLSGNWYYFSMDANYGPRMLYDDVKHITNADGGSAWYGFDENGRLRSSGWYNSLTVEYMGETHYNGNWYYFDTNGKAYTGWKQISGKWYYFGDGGRDPYACIRLNNINGKYYYFDPETSAMCSNGWIDPYASDDYYDHYMGFSNHNWIYLGSDGVAYTGFKTIDGKTYYFNPNSSNGPFLSYNFQYINNVRYFFGDSGVLRQGGWFQYAGEYYYAEKNGAIVESSWKTIGGNTYYFNNGGTMATGLMTIENKLYDFGDNGVCANPPKS